MRLSVEVGRVGPVVLRRLEYRPVRTDNECAGEGRRPLREVTITPPQSEQLPAPSPRGGGHPQKAAQRRVLLGDRDKKGRQLLGAGWAELRGTDPRRARLGSGVGDV